MDPADLTPFETLQFYATASYPCSYLPDRTARSQVATPGHVVQGEVYSHLVAQGFRRSGLYTYRPHCDHCQACVPLRIDVNAFVPNRSQRRCIQQFANLESRVLPLAFVPEHYALYQRYQHHRHAGGGMDLDDPSQYSQFLLQSRVDSRMVEFWQPSDGEQPKRLCMVAMVDVLQDGLSAVYTFYNPALSGGLGSYAVLWQIEQARQMGLPYLYLGYWIEASAKMSYKTRFKPHQMLRNGQWETQR